MKCTSCGFEEEKEFSFCPQCGAAALKDMAQIETAEPVNTAAQRVLKAIQDNLFLVICILMSVSCGLTLLGSGPDVISILFTIFLWLTYAQGRKGIADAKHLRCISGTVYAQYVVLNVVAVMLIVIGGICGVAFSALLSDPGFLEGLLEVVPAEIAPAANLLASVSGALVFVIFALVGGLTLVLNLFSTRYIHRFAKSLYKSVESGSLELKRTKATYIWLYIFGIFAGLSLLGNLGTDAIVALNNGAVCATNILAAVLIKKYLVTEE